MASLERDQSRSCLKPRASSCHPKSPLMTALSSLLSWVSIQLFPSSERGSKGDSCLCPSLQKPAVSQEGALPSRAFVFGYFVYLGSLEAFPPWREEVGEGSGTAGASPGVEIHGPGAGGITQIGKVTPWASSRGAVDLKGSEAGLGGGPWVWFVSEISAVPSPAHP